MKKDTAFLQAKKQRREPITMLTCYDYPTAALEERAGIDVIFVGDSVGTNVLGYSSPTEVTLEDIVHHLRAARRGVHDAFLLVDMPFGAYTSPDQALATARTLRRYGADGVKLEGGLGQAPIVRSLVDEGFDVCGHIGFTPQTGGPRATLQGRSFESARELWQSALALEAAGVHLLVLELVPEAVSKLITERLSIPTIGIGAGRYCDGQVQVVNDILGITPFRVRHAKLYASLGDLTAQAIEQYRADVEHGRFPEPAHVRDMRADEITKLEAWIQRDGARASGEAGRTQGDQ